MFKLTGKYWQLTNKGIDYAYVTWFHDILKVIITNISDDHFFIIMFFVSNSKKKCNILIIPCMLNIRLHYLHTL